MGVAVTDILERALERVPLTREEAYLLYDEAPLQLLCSVADTLRQSAVHNPKVVTWSVEGSVAITNVCKAGCKFCTFHCMPHDEAKAYITTMAEYRQKIDEALRHGANQLLLQGGLHPRLGIEFYEKLLSQIKREYPTLRLNALSGAEVAHIAALSGITTLDTLRRLKGAGLDILSGVGADILSEGVRRRLSTAKPSAREWVMVMHEAHSLDIPTTATMMYGHVERRHERIDHLITLRDLQAHKPAQAQGFTSFMPYPLISVGTQLESEGVAPRISSTEYLRLVAMSRIVLHNVPNIEVSWQTVGSDVTEIALHSGANALGSIMVGDAVSLAGATAHLDGVAMQTTIRRAGFTPRLRDQL